jgi:hypothetical protein
MLYNCYTLEVSETMSSAHEKIKIGNYEIECFDAPTMYKMSNDEYRKFIRSGELMYVDHHPFLRSYIADYPIATTRDQLDILIEELHRMRSQLPEHGS